MKDQKALLLKCLRDDVPAIVISSNDKLAIPVLLKYLEEAKKAGCSYEFLEDFADVIRDFNMYQLEESEKVKLPD